MTEFWYWYQDLKKTILPLSDGDNEEVILAEVGELSLDSLPLPSLDIKFCICDKEFEVRDALLLAVLPMCVITMSMTDEPDEWTTIEGVREYTLGFFNGVVRGMLN